METNYAGLIKTPDGWWLCTSKKIYDAWDLPEGPIRDGIIAAAIQSGLVHFLGPGSMTGEEAYDKSLEILGVADFGAHRDEIVDMINKNSADQEEE